MTPTGRLTPSCLRCEYRTDPLGIDAPKPRLSWIVASGRRAQRQTAYRIIVARDAKLLAKNKGDLWDTGKVKSDATAHIEYAGQKLKSHRMCHWKVCVWDRDGRRSEWSAAACWSMGLLKASDWHAGWIGYDAPQHAVADTLTLSAANWIWAPTDKAGEHPGTVCFRREFLLPAGAAVERAHVLATAPGGFKLWVNGTPVCESGGDQDAWRHPKPIDITQHLRPGKNLIAIKSKRGDLPGIMAKMVAVPAEGKPVAVASDHTWKCSTKPKARWHARTASGSGWRKASELGTAGSFPWGQIDPGELVLPAPGYLRKEFHLAKPVRRATVHATALGIYDLHINGQPVSGGYFAPGWTDYGTRIYYNTYDVTPLLREGGNAVGAVLADGWYAGYVGFGHQRNHYGEKLRLRAQLRVEYEDGTSEIIGTDRSWRAATGPLLEADFLMGERYDARREMPGWDAPGFDASQWRRVSVTKSIAAQVQACPGVPVREFAEIRPVKITQPKKGAFVYDLGQNFAGVVRLKVNAHRGRKITLRFAERLNPNGTVYTTNLRSARATDSYTCRGGGEEVWQPRFTFHGFQYVEVRGYPGTPGPDAITGIALSSDTPASGGFSCSDRMVNQLYSNAVWTQRANFIDVPTDCPQRDERLGWTGDAQIYIRTACYNTDTAAFFTKWLADLDDAQTPGGAYPDVAPHIVATGSGVAAWGDAGVICPWTLYLMYGDVQVLRRYYKAMVRWIDWCKGTCDGLLRPEYGYGDWLSINADTPKAVLATAYFAYSTSLMARIAGVLGKKADATKYTRLFESISRAFNKAYVDADGRIKGETQTDYVLALAFDLLPEDRRPLAVKHLTANIEQRGWLLSTGFLGTKDLMPVLTAAGRNDVAYRLLHNKRFPSWGFSIKHGATSIWERWNGWTPDEGFGDPGMNSFAHYAFGAVAEWLFRVVAGIDTDGPGFKLIVIRPQPGGKLKHASAHYDSVRGRIASSWQRSKSGLTLSVAVPANTTAEVHVPAADATAVKESGKPATKAEGVKFLRMANSAAVFEVGSGEYEFSV